MNPVAIVPVFVLTAITEIVGCYLVLLWTRGGRSPLLLVGAAIALGVFAWLLSFHPNAGRAYAAYGGVYVASAVVWGWLVEKRPPDQWDLIGAGVCLVGMAIIAIRSEALSPVRVSTPRASRTPWAAKDALMPRDTLTNYLIQVGTLSAATRTLTVDYTHYRLRSLRA